MTPHIVGILSSLAWLLGLGLLSARLARGMGFPDLVLFVAIGVLAGPHLLGLISLPASGTVGQLVVTGGAIFMLYEGGRAVDLAVFRRIWLGTALLAVLGVVITGGIVAGAVHAVLRAPWPIALLVGAAVASTDPATIVPLFQQIRVKQHIQQLVVSESAFNDATGAVFTVTMLAIVKGGTFSAGTAGTTFGRLILVGVLVGMGIGLLVQFLVVETAHRRGVLDRHEENAVATLLAMVAAYAVASVLGGSGFMAVFLAGIVRGNAQRWNLPVPAERETTHDTFLAFLATAVRILIFGVLGANVDLSLLGSLGFGGLAVAGVLLFVARPITVGVCLGLDRLQKWSLREMLFVSWVRETGVVPAALASLLLAARAPGAPMVAAVVFLAVVVTILVQAPTTGLWAKVTGVSETP